MQWMRFLFCGPICGYITGNSGQAGSNTFTVALWVVGGDEKGTQCLGVQPGHPVPGGYKYWDLVLQVGNSRIWDSKMSWVPRFLWHIVSFNASGVGLSPLYCGHFWPIVPMTSCCSIKLRLSSVSRPWPYTDTVADRFSVWKVQFCVALEWFILSRCIKQSHLNRVI
jgi:hypothetical protein